MEKLLDLKRVCLTRKSFGDIPKMKSKIDEIENYCRERKVAFQLLTTPARFTDRQNKENGTISLTMLTRSPITLILCPADRASTYALDD
jgi:hypothetical protein